MLGHCLKGFDIEYHETEWSGEILHYLEHLSHIFKLIGFHIDHVDIMNTDWYYLKLKPGTYLT